MNPWGTPEVTDADEELTTLYVYPAQPFVFAQRWRIELNPLIKLIFLEFTSHYCDLYKNLQSNEVSKVLVQYI